MFALIAAIFVFIAYISLNCLYEGYIISNEAYSALTYLVMLIQIALLIYCIWKG